MANYSEAIIHEIRSRAAIEQVIGESVRLERRGNRLLGLCPFHSEKSPSFNVNPEIGRYHCFGCQASGDVFSFLQKRDGLSFVETIEKLAGQTGVQLPARESNARSDTAQADKERYFRATQFAAQFYADNLLSGRYPEATAYIARRGVPLEAVRAFGLGFAPGEWSGLVDAAASKRVPVADLEFAGLAKPRERGGGHFDMFRNRLMFPVRDLSKRVVAFSGRALSSEEKAKYINSPETPFYKKAKELFGIDLAQGPIKAAQRAILVEGNFDVVSLHAHGVSQAVAPLGTALTLDQVRLLRRFTKSVVLFFDGDKAGRAAARKSLDILLEADFPEILFAQLPDGADPDDIARRGGADAVQALVQQAKPLLDLLIEELILPATGSASPSAKAAAVSELAPLMAKIKDTTLLEAWIQEISRRTGLSPGELARRFRPGATATGYAGGQPQRAVARPPIPSTPAFEDRSAPTPFDDAPFGEAPFEDGPLPASSARTVELAPLNPMETELIVLLHRRAALLLPFLHARTDISMEQREVAEWARAVAAAHQENGPSLSRAFEMLEEGPLKSVIARALMLAGPLYEEKIQSAFHAVSLKIRMAWVVTTRARLIDELQAASKRGDDDGAFVLLNQLQRLNEFERDAR
jgi:DNA primase